MLGRSATATRVVEADFARVHIEMRRKGVTLMLLWQEYRAAYEGRRTWAYTQFCEHYKAFARTLKRSMRQQRRAGEKLFIDYAGPTLELADGTRAQIFVAAMGASSYTFACVTADQSMRSWLAASARHVGVKASDRGDSPDDKPFEYKAYTTKHDEVVGAAELCGHGRGSAVGQQLALIQNDQTLGDGQRCSAVSDHDEGHIGQGVQNLGANLRRLCCSGCIGCVRHSCCQKIVVICRRAAPGCCVMRVFAASKRG